jgi:tetratricopeptide (TPR) repeat protein
MRKIKAHNKPAQKYLCLRVLVSFVFLLTLIFILPSTSSALIGIKEGDKAISFTLKDVNGSAVNAGNSFGKKPVIIVFWELAMSDSFLDYSMDELRFLNEIYSKHNESTAPEIFAVYTPEEDGEVPHDEMERVKNLIKINKIKFPVLIDNGFNIFRKYGVIALPSTIMINKKGEIKFIYPSFPLAAHPLFKKEIDSLMGLVEESKEDASQQKAAESQAVRFYSYAVQMYKKGMLEQAISPLRKSIETTPDYSSARNLMGAILWKKGNFEDARNEFYLASQIDDKSLPAYFNSAVLMYESEDYGSAERYLKKVVDVDDTVAEAHYLLGLLYIKGERDEKAAAELSRALSLFEKRRQSTGYEIHAPSAFHRISTLYALSGLYRKKGDTEEALSLLQRAVEIALGHDMETDNIHLDRGIDVIIDD